MPLHLLARFEAGFRRAYSWRLAVVAAHHRERRERNRFFLGPGVRDLREGRVQAAVASPRGQGSGDASPRARFAMGSIAFFMLNAVIPALGAWLSITCTWDYRDGD